VYRGSVRDDNNNKAVGFRTGYEFGMAVLMYAREIVPKFVLPVQ
jgi:hypothetical protein